MDLSDISIIETIHNVSVTDPRINFIYKPFDWRFTRLFLAFVWHVSNRLDFLIFTNKFVDRTKFLHL